MKGQPECIGWELRAGRRQGFLSGCEEFKTDLTLLNCKRSHVVGFINISL